jgi:hypothetical protein
MPAGEFVVVWESKAGRHAGEHLRPALQRRRHRRKRIPSQHDDGESAAAAVSINSSRNFVVVWQSVDRITPEAKTGIYAQRFNAAGVKQGGEFLVNTTVANDQTAPAVTLTDSGNFTVVWSSVAQDNADGRQASTPRALPGTVRGGLNSSSIPPPPMCKRRVDRPPDGTLVMVWQSDNQDGNRNGVFGEGSSRRGGDVQAAMAGDRSMTFTSLWVTSTCCWTPIYTGPELLRAGRHDHHERPRNTGGGGHD